MRRGPITDQSGTYYEVTDDTTGKVRREYVNTSPAAATTQISPDGSIVQPAYVTGDQALVTQPLDVQAPVSQHTPAAMAPTTDQARPQRAAGGDPIQLGGGDYGGGMASPQLSGTSGPPAVDASQHPLAAQIGGRLSGLGPRIAAANGSDPGDYRPSISSDAGWAGPTSVGVFQGSRVDPGRLQTGGKIYTGDRAFRSNGTRVGGGNTSPMYDKMRARGDAMRGKIQGMADNLRGSGSSYSGGGGYGGGGSYKTPNYPSQKKIDKAYEQYLEDLDAPMKVHGVLKRQGVDPDMAMGILGSPQMLLKGLGKNLDPNDPGDQELFGLPITDMALITKGTRGRGLMSRTPRVKLPGILAKAGYDPIKPEYKRMMDPSDVANSISRMYKNFMAGGELPSMDDMLGDLSHTRKNSAIGQSLAIQAKEDPGGAVDAVNQYIRSAVLGGRPTDNYTRALDEGLPMLMANQGTRLLGRKPESMFKSVRKTARNLLNS
jgi:hypothetical protein